MDIIQNASNIRISSMNCFLCVNSTLGTLKIDTLNFTNNPNNNNPPPSTNNNNTNVSNSSNTNP